MRVEIVRSRAALGAMATAWDRLAQARGLPMLSHAWVVSCAETLYREDELYIVTARTEEELCGIAPLVAIRRAGLKRLELIGSARLYEPSDLLYDTEGALIALVQAIADARRPVVLSRIPAGSPIISRFRSVVGDRGVVATRQAAGTVAVQISSTWKEYASQLSAQRRYDLRRARRRLDERGTVTFHLHDPRPEEVESMFLRLVRIEAAGWKTRNHSSLDQRHALRHFFAHYARQAAQSGQLRISFLDVNGTSVAAQLAVEYANGLWLLKIGYDEAWSRCSPGSQLLAETMRDAFERGLKSFEFLGTDEPWLHGWVTQPTVLTTLMLYPRSVSGLCGWLTDQAKRAAKYLSHGFSQAAKSLAARTQVPRALERSR